MSVIATLVHARHSLFRIVPLMRDIRVPLALKLIAGAVALLIISPIDIFSDIPVLGLLDDGALLTVLAMWFVGRATRHTEKIPGTALAPIR